MSEYSDDTLSVDKPADESPDNTPFEEQESSPSKSSQLSKAGLVSTLAAATAACGGGGSSDSGGSIISGIMGGTPAPTVVKPETDAEAARFLLHASISASPGEIAAVRDRGFEPWLDQQMNARNAQSAQDFIAAQGMDDVTSTDFVFNRGVADLMVWSQLLSGANPVRARAALALSEFFVVSTNTSSNLWPGSAMGAYWDILSDNAFGNFRDLIEEISLNPAMGVFLNTRGNQKADPRTGRVPDENYGREVMQLFSIGLFELNNDGTRRTSGGEPIETYTNEDVTGISKVFTGYDFDATGVTFTAAPDGGNYQIPDPSYLRNPMTADTSRWRFPRNESFHSDDAKTFLGTTIPAGTGAAESMRLAMDALFNHPNVGPFFGKQMIQRLVTSNPSPAYVGRVADAFNNNGSGTRGDLRAVFKAILLDDEAQSAAGLTDTTYGKVREPMLRFAQWARTSGLNSDSGFFLLGNLSDAANRLGQAPLRSPSVFNFFRPGYSPAGTQSADMGLVAPEFQIVNETSVAGYVNFMERSIDGGGFWMRDFTANYSAELGIAHDSTALLDRIDLLYTGGQLTEGSRTKILNALNDYTVMESSDEATKLERIHAAILLVMASNEYIVQR
ncbi:MAG: DUF1800 domain-containing protein [Erythrobacter sp.]